MTPFGSTWSLFLVGMLAVTIALHLALRTRPDRVRRATMVGIAILNWFFSTWFTFDRISHPENDFPLSQNWPFHFCTLVTFLLIPGVWLTPKAKRIGWMVRPLHALLFFPGALAGFLAVCSPAAEYTGMPLWHMNTLFFTVHALNVVLPMLHASLGYYRPTVKDALLSLVWFFVGAMGVLAITLFARAFVDPGANYMYFFDPEGAGILETLWGLIGIPVLYEVPLLPILAPVLIGMVGLHRLVEKLARAIRDLAGQDRTKVA